MSNCKTGLGSGGTCICVKCGSAISHQRGVPCQEINCPNCGAKMLREGSYHHELYLDKQKKKG